MRNASKLLIALLFLGSSFATTVTGTIRDAYGQLWNGTITFGLNTSVIDYISHEVVPSTPLTVNVVNGILYLTNGSTTISIKGNDTLLPSNTAYYALFKDLTGQPTNLYLYSITGSTYDLGTAIPTPITTTNISYGNLLGLNSVTIKPSSTSVTQLGIQTASAANIFSVINNKVVIGNQTSGNTTLQLFGTSGTSLSLNPIAAAGPFMTLLDGGNSTHSGGGLIFGSNSSQFGAAIKYDLTSGANNSNGNIVFLTRSNTVTANLANIFTVGTTNLTIGGQSGSTGGGLEPNGGGFKHIRVPAASMCTTAAAAGSICASTVTWTTPFADANYSFVCTGDVLGSGVPVIAWTSGKIAASVGVTITATTAAAANMGIDCIGVHD